MATAAKARTARTTVPLSPALAWQMRSMYLAQVNHLRAMLHGRSIAGCDIYSVPSTSHPGTHHIVRHHIEARTIECDCIAAQHNRACGHAGAVLVAIEQAQANDDAWRWWMHGGESW